MKYLALILIIVLKTNLIFGQIDSTKINLITNHIIEDTNQLRSIIYLYRLTNGKSPENYEVFQNFLSERNIYQNNNNIREINFFDDNKVSFNFICDNTNSSFILNQNEMVTNLNSFITADYFGDVKSTIHSLEIILESAEVSNLKLSTPDTTFLYIRLEKEDILSLKSVVKNEYQEESPEWVVSKNIESYQNQDFGMIANLINKDDLQLIKEGFDYVVTKDSSMEFLSQLDGNYTKEEFLSITPENFYPIFMNFIFKIQPQFAFAMKNLKISILGKVTEGNLIHVVCRDEVNIMGESVSQIEVISLIEKNGKYYLSLKDDIKNMVKQLKNMY